MTNEAFVEIAFSADGQYMMLIDDQLMTVYLRQP